MLIVSADDFGRNHLTSTRILTCWNQGIVTSIGAMVFMEDSERASELISNNIIDMGLHLNFTEEFTQKIQNPLLLDYHNLIRKYLTKFKYNFLIYNPTLRNHFYYV